MGQALEVYLMPHERDLKVFGCRRRKLLKEVLQAAGGSLQGLDEEFDVKAEGLITHAEALQELFSGELTREGDCGYIYGHAYEECCAVIGKRLSNNHFIPTAVEWFNTLDKFFKWQGVSLGFHKLLFEEFPIPVDTDATPCGGFWEHKEIKGARSPLEAAIAFTTDADMAGALHVVLGWLNEAIDSPGSVIVGFFD